MELLLIRHGESFGNVGTLISAPSDPLTPHGVEQVKALGKHLTAEGWQPQRLLTSPLMRARQTAAILVECLQLPPFEVLEDLAEMDVGPWGGTPWEDFMQAHPELVVDDDGDLPMDWSYPGGESLAATRERGTRALQHLASLGEADPRPVIAVAHGTLLSQGLSGLLGLPPSPHTQFSWANSAVAILYLEAGRPPKLTRLNDLRHLEDLPEA